MPIYEFKCNTCAAEFEAIVASFSKVNEVTCGKCGSVDINRILSTVNSKVKRGGSFPAAAPPPGCRSKSGFS
jgi:putative FmdB family regulatory protein